MNKNTKAIMSRSSNFVTNLSGESVMILPHTFRKMAHFMGIGLVMKISRGNEFDVVNVRFGIQNKIRPIVVRDSKARRQLITLKRGQYGIFYGVAQLTSFKNENYKDQDRYYKQWSFFALALQGMFVPKMFDIKKRKEDIDNGEEIDYIDPMTKEQENTFADVVNQLLNTNLYETDYEGDDEDE